MRDAASPEDVFQRGLRLARAIMNAGTDAEAADLFLDLVREHVHATRGYLYALDARGEPHLTRARGPAASSKEEEGCRETAVKDALARHARKQLLAASATNGAGATETDETIPLALVAKVIALGAAPVGVAVIVKEGGRPFTEDERADFTSHCLNAANGFARRNLRARPETPRVPATALAEGVLKVKTSRLTVPRDHFAKPLGGILGTSAAIKKVRELIWRYARADFPVLILGESGTGKELVARAVHDLSARREKPFREVNSAGLAEGLIEKELFGHEKGAFTGADREKKGLIRSSEGGTIFFDEIGDLPLDMQPTLLRVLEDGKVLPVGATDPIAVDFRVVARRTRTSTRG